MNTLFPNPPLRRTNGRFATKEQARTDKVMKENQRLKVRNAYLERKLEALEKAILNRHLVYTNMGGVDKIADFFLPEMS